jgi:uncharacterized membrane protein
VPSNVYTTLIDPLADQSGFSGTFAYGINNVGDIVGYYSNSAGNHGFLLSGGIYTSLNDLLATQGTRAFSINDVARSWGLTGMLRAGS